MSDARSPLEQALDLVVFAPIGLALTVVEDFPQLAEKGRTRLQQRATTAKLVGQFAVAQARRRMAAPAERPPAAAPSTAPAAAASPAPASTPPVPPTPVGGPLGSPVAGSPVVGPEVVGPGGVPGQTVPSPLRRPIDRGRAPAVAPHPSSETLAIPSYDLLSASQVVQRLASLSGPELDAVCDYEVATRGRRTILARIQQLQQG